MKLPHFLTILICLFSVACNVTPEIKITTAAGDQVHISPAARLGGKGGLAARSGGARVVVVDDNQSSFRDFIWGVVTKAFIGEAGSVANAAIDSAEAIDLASIKEATQQAKIASDTELGLARTAAEAAMHTAPAAPAGPP